MSIVHICRGPKLGDPYPTPAEWGPTVVTDCCVCRMPVEETVTRSGHQEWYGWTHVIKCAPDAGCNVNPRRKFGATLRAMTRGPW